MVALWNTQERAHLTRDVNVDDQIDTGTELLEAHYALDSAVCGCSTWYWTQGARPIQQVMLYLPRQAGYPLFFMAEVLADPTGHSEPAGDVTAVLFVTRSAQSEPWRIAMQVFDNGYSPPTTATAAPSLDQNGYDIAVSAASTHAAMSWPSLLAAYYTHLKDDGRPPAGSPFLPGPLTTGTDLTIRRQGFEFAGIRYHYAFAAAVLGGPWVFNIGQSVESCADIEEYETSTWVKPHTVFEQVDNAKPNWGPDLDSGFYSQIDTTWERAVCITPSPTGGLNVWGADSASGYPIHDGGIPATAGPGTTRVT